MHNLIWYKKVFEVFVTKKSNKLYRSQMKFCWRYLSVIFMISYFVVKRAYMFVTNDDFTRKMLVIIDF